MNWSLGEHELPTDVENLVSLESIAFLYRVLITTGYHRKNAKKDKFSRPGIESALQTYFNNILKGYTVAVIDSYDSSQKRDSGINCKLSTGKEYVLKKDNDMLMSAKDSKKHLTISGATYRYFDKKYYNFANNNLKPWENLKDLHEKTKQDNITSNCLNPNLNY
ncbi:Hypothetical predicted protein [Octopus vulgaris]|uniref:Uncharacterized protein n=1 Tax=Octopus vulgaris TaxID=6645 RepID=A0AA36FFJ3_OCTVU|nr:Hypothetical predicted protein [Octopus vulgaris]